MTTEYEIVDAIRQAGWTQGSFFRYARDSIDTESLLVVVSHPCDVASMSFIRDPDIEVTEAHPVSQVDGNYTLAKNSRNLDFDTSLGHFRLIAGESFMLDRKLLLNYNPVAHLTEIDRRVLAAWLVARYVRPAFADEFNRRLRPSLSRINRILKTRGTHLSGIYVATTLDELSSDEEYSIDLVATMREEDWAEREKFTECSEALDELLSAFGADDQMNVTASELTAENDVPLSLLRTHSRWDAQSLSFREGGDAVYPPDAQ